MLINQCTCLLLVNIKINLHAIASSLSSKWAFVPGRIILSFSKKLQKKNSRPTIVLNLVGEVNSYASFISVEIF